MAETINTLLFWYNYMFEELPDYRTKEWFLVAKPYQPILVIGLYLMFVLKWGPRFMKNREPFKMDRIMIIYNVLQVLCCGYICYAGIYEAWGWKYKWVCEPLDTSRSEHAINVAKLVYYYYLLKVVDLLDTVIFVLRKKYSQITFLHVYHHSGMVSLIWSAATYFPGGHGTSVGLINSFVHVIMYSYYLVTIAVPKVKNNLWWKKYITQLQLLQFLLCVIHMSSILFVKGCQYPQWIAFIYVPLNLFMLMLFVDFYINTYIKKRKIKNDEKTENYEKPNYDFKEDNRDIKLLNRNNRNSIMELKNVIR